MNKAELARRVGVDRSFISMLLNGKRNASAKVAVRLVSVIPGTVLLDWLFARHIANKKLQTLVGRAK